MSDYNQIYNGLEQAGGETYFIQDGSLLEQPMIRNIDSLLECERDSVQMMMEDNYE